MTTRIVFNDEVYLTPYGCPPEGAGRPSPPKQSGSGARVPESVRLVFRDHLVIENERYKKDLVLEWSVSL